MKNRSIIVFHCEFSQKRGPQLCGKLRELDRQKNIDKYPLLCYPEIYVLEGGYKLFQTEYTDYCGDYIQMEDKRFKLEKQESLKMHKDCFKLSNI